MFRNRKKSFLELNIENYGHTVVEIEQLMATTVSSEMKMVIMESAIQKINKQEKLITTLLNYQYYLIKYYLSFLTILFCKKFIIHKMYFSQKDHQLNYLIQKDSVLYLYDNGIYFNKCHIPYENILQFGIEKDICVLHILGKIEKKDDVLTMSLDKNILKVIFKMDTPGLFLKSMKNNMFYHIKYNKVNETAIQFYYEDRYNLTPIN